jgi:hypothetical protein
MPVQPDPTHPKFLEGDDVLHPTSEQEDDVSGHLRANVTEEPGGEPEDLKGLLTDDGSDDVEGHVRA